MALLTKTHCKNCRYCLKTKTLSGIKYKCLLTNEKVNKNYYCGRVKPFSIEENIFPYSKKDLEIIKELKKENKQ